MYPWFLNMWYPLEDGTRAKRDSPEPSNVQNITLIIHCGDWIIVIFIILPAQNAKTLYHMEELDERLTQLQDHIIKSLKEIMIFWIPATSLWDKGHLRWNL